MTLAVRVFEDEAAVFGIAAAWEKIERRPFQSPAWLLAWWRQFGTGRPVVAVAGEERLAGVFACTVLDEGGVGKLLPMGCGISDYCDLSLAADAPEGVATRLVEAVVRAADGVASCDFVDVAPGARLRGAGVPAGWTGAWRETATCPVLRLDGRGLREAIAGRTHRKLRMNRHRVERLGGCSVALEGAGALEVLARLHGARWAGRGEPGGVFADERVLGCLRDAAPALLARGAMRIYVLRFGGREAACCLVLVEAGRWMLYLSGFDEAHGFWSPGTVLLGAIVEAAIAEGAGEIDFLRGGESYKYDWGAVDRFSAEWRLVPA